jgi:hypothetical protein
MGDRAESVWADLVSAERRAIELRAELGRLPDRNSIIAASLSPRAGAWNQRTALEYLLRFPGDVAAHVPELFDLSLNGKWGSIVLDILAKGDRETVLRQVRDVAATRQVVEVEDYANLAGLLSRLAAREDLVELVSSALRSPDAEVRELGEFLAEHHDVRSQLRNDSE